MELETSFGLNERAAMRVKVFFCEADKALCMGCRVSGRRNSWMNCSTVEWVVSGNEIDLKVGKRKTWTPPPDMSGVEKEEFVIMMLLYGCSRNMLSAWAFWEYTKQDVEDRVPCSNRQSVPTYIRVFAASAQHGFQLAAKLAPRRSVTVMFNSARPV